jgi:ribosome-binding ATPase YchF (GTP1/OBG family)
VATIRTFLRADVIGFTDFEEFRGDRLKLMMEGKLKNETKKYIVNDGDIVEYFTHNKKK